MRRKLVTPGRLVLLGALTFAVCIAVPSYFTMRAFDAVANEAPTERKSRELAYAVANQAVLARILVWPARAGLVMVAAGVVLHFRARRARALP